MAELPVMAEQAETLDVEAHANPKLNTKITDFFSRVTERRYLFECERDMLAVAERNDAKRSEQAQISAARVKKTLQAAEQAKRRRTMLRKITQSIYKTSNYKIIYYCLDTQYQPPPDLNPDAAVRAAIDDIVDDEQFMLYNAAHDVPKKVWNARPPNWKIIAEYATQYGYSHLRTVFPEESKKYTDFRRRRLRL